jgi:hypothetical protein
MEGEGARLQIEKAWREAFGAYVREVEKTLELLKSPKKLTAAHLEAVEQQQAAEREAFEKYRKARSDYLELIRRTGEMAILLAAFHFSR